MYWSFLTRKPDPSSAPILPHSRLELKQPPVDVVISGSYNENSSKRCNRRTNNFATWAVRFYPLVAFPLFMKMMGLCTCAVKKRKHRRASKSVTSTQFRGRTLSGYTLPRAMCRADGGPRNWLRECRGYRSMRRNFPATNGFNH